MRKLGCGCLLLPLMGPALGATTPVACVLVAEGPAVVQASGTAVALPTRLADCSNVEIKSGSITACYLDDQGQRQCVSLRPGDHFANQVHDAAGGSADTLWSSVLSVLRGDTGSRPARSRGLKLAPFLPAGTVLLPGDELEVFVPPAGAAGPQILRIETDDAGPAVVFEAANAGGELRMPAAKFARGKAYRWILRQGDAESRGSFTVAGSLADQDLRAARAVLRDRKLSAAGRDILLIELYAERGYRFEREVAATRLQALTGSGH